MECTLQDKYELIQKDIISYSSINPIEIAKDIMHKEYINIHGPEHHFLDGAAFLVSYYNATKSINLDAALNELKQRSINMPGAMCGKWAVCGACTSLGAALSIIHDVGPLTENNYYRDDMEYTSLVLNKMSKIGGPRCCKRNGYIAITTAIDFVKEKYGVELEKSNIKCEFSSFNKQCIKEKCPFSSF